MKHAEEMSYTKDFKFEDINEDTYIRFKTNDDKYLYFRPNGFSNLLGWCFAGVKPVGIYEHPYYIKEGEEISDRVEISLEDNNKE